MKNVLCIHVQQQEQMISAEEQQENITLDTSGIGTPPLGDL